MGASPSYCDFMLFNRKSWPHRHRAPCPRRLLVEELEQRRQLAGSYSVVPVPIPFYEGGGMDYRLLLDDFQFGSLREKATDHAVVFRPHPDHGDPNGFGT